MTYLSDKTKTRRGYLNIALGAVAFSLFVYFWPAFQVAAYPAMEPLVRSYGGAKGIASFMPEFAVTYVTSHKALFKRASELELAVEHLENELAQKDAALRELSSRADAASSAPPAPVIVMYPIAQDVTKLYSTVLLSKGYRDGVEQGGIVYIRGQQAACEVIEVHDQTTLCELLSKGNRITEGVSASSSIALSLVGAGGGNFTAEVPNSTPLAVGESVYLRSNQSFKLGTIIAIKEDEQATGSIVYVRGAYNPVTSSLFYVNARYAP